jgi:putative addiction module component (TIGR02574 family)
MTPAFDALAAQVLALPPDQRFELAQRLWASVEGQIDEDEALFAEIERRSAEMAQGSVQTFSHDEVMRDARKALGQ